MKVIAQYKRVRLIDDAGFCDFTPDYKVQVRGRFLFVPYWKTTYRGCIDSHVMGEFNAALKDSGEK